MSEPITRMLAQFDQRPLTAVERDFVDLVRFRFKVLAEWVEFNIPGGPERTVAMRKILEGKDAAVRAYIFPAQLEAYVRLEDVAPNVKAGAITEGVEKT